MLVGDTVAETGGIDMLRVRRLKIAAAAFGVAFLALAGSAHAVSPGGQYGGPGSGAGMLGPGAQGVAVSSDGTVFVADPGNERVDVFSQAGGFLRAFGWDVVPGGGGGFEVCVSGCQAGAAGGGAGQFNEPGGLALGGDGNLYVA